MRGSRSRAASPSKGEKLTAENFKFDESDGYGDTKDPDKCLIFTYSADQFGGCDSEEMYKFLTETNVDFWHNWNNKEFFHYVNEYYWYYDEMNIPYTKIYDTYFINDVVKEEGSSFKISDLEEIVGTGKVFQEGQCSIKNHYEKIHFIDGVVYTVRNSNEPITLDFFYGATDYYNYLGYYYYPEGATEEEILKADRYLLITDGRPRNNISIDNGTVYKTSLSEDVSRYERAVESGNEADIKAMDKTVTGTKYQLTYFDENGVGHQTFPEGYKIAFFLIANNNGSVTQMDSNPVCFEHFAQTIPQSCRTGKRIYKTYFVTYRWGNKTILGIEDGIDHDMNDILIQVNGIENTNIIPMDKPSKPQSWIIAAEDLGGVYDFDFNDVVFGVTHISGENTATVKALASGGTLPVFLHSQHPQADGNHIMVGDKDYVLNPKAGGTGEFHSWFSRNTGSKTQVNHNEFTDDGAEVVISVDGDFTISSSTVSGVPFDNDGHMGGFWITVGKHDDTTKIKAPKKGENKAPQMFLVPSTWNWPAEGISIHDVYGEDNFVKWKDGWWLPEFYGASYVNHTWNK